MVWKTNAILIVFLITVLVLPDSLEQQHRSSENGDFLLNPHARNNFPYNYPSFHRNPTDFFRSPPHSQQNSPPIPPYYNQDFGDESLENSPDDSVSQRKPSSSASQRRPPDRLQLPKNSYEANRLLNAFGPNAQEESRPYSSNQDHRARYQDSGGSFPSKLKARESEKPPKVEGHINVKVYPPSRAVKDVLTEEEIEEIVSYDTMRSTPPQTTRKATGDKKSTEDLELAYSHLGKNGPIALPHRGSETGQSGGRSAMGDIYFVVIVAGCSAAAIFGVIAAGFFFYRLQKTTKAAADVDYPAYGVTGPNKDHNSPNGDRKLAQSAQMYHYQHQKQQMIAVEKASASRHTSASDVDSEEENEEGDYTVYECPGLAPTGEMEVKNPLFHDDSTPGSPSVTIKDKAEK